MRKVSLLLSALALPLSTAATAQLFDKPEMAMPVGDKLGEISFANSGNAAAQAPFLRGVKLLHNFEYPEAIESFQAAQKADPSFALAYWGEAMAHNYTLWADQQTDQARAALAKLGPTRETRAAKAKTARERRWLDAVETLYGSGTKFERDVAYADKMDQLAKTYPNDVEAQVFDALATLGRSHGTRNQANYLKAGAILEKLFPTHQHHPGVVHYMIHSYDDPAHAKLGLKAAMLYDKIAPESPHALHMTSHIFLAMGMWPETEAANLHAGTAMNKMMAENHMPPVACGHGYGWMVYARLQQGKDVSRQLDDCLAQAQHMVKEAKELPVVSTPEGAFGSWADMAVRTGVETGKWPNWAELPAGHLTFARFFEDYGRVLQNRHDAAKAEAALADLKSDRDIIAANYPKEEPDDDQALPWVDRAVAQGKAVVRLAKGDTEGGLKLLRKAAEAEAALPPPFGPPALQKPSYEMLGDELLALGRKVEAADAYRRALAAAPGRRLSLAGLKAANGNSTLASEGAPH
jgi:tetratricopeptide (TPR) repeat protein